MSISDAARADLYTGLTEVLGRNRAETLMAHLPTFDPVDIVTKADLGEFRADVDRRFGGVEQRLGGVEQRLDGVEQRLDLLSGRFDLVDQRLDDMARHFEGIDRRFEGIDRRFEGFDQRFQSIDGHLLALGKRIDRLYYVFVAGVLGIIAAMGGLAALVA